MDLKELYKKEKGLCVDVEVGGLSVLYYSEDYVEWLEAKINYTRCCESDSELLLCGVCDEETKHDTSNLKELRCLKCGNVAKE